MFYSVNSDYFCKVLQFIYKFVFVIKSSYICKLIIFFTKNMVERIKKIISDKNMTLSLFTKTTDIQPTTMSHIINGRKIEGKEPKKQTPSTDVITKILTAFPDISADWLIMGTGSMYKSQRPFIELDLFSEPEAKPIQTPTHSISRNEIKEKGEEKPAKTSQKQMLTFETSMPDDIDKVVIFFKNRTYLRLIPEE